MESEIANDQPHYIYGLFDPNTGAIRYIGRSTNPEKRFASHRNMSQNDVKTAWVRELRKNGQRPELAIIETCTAETVKDAEWGWIKRCMEAGADLTNRIYPGCEAMNYTGRRRR